MAGLTSPGRWAARKLRIRRLIAAAKQRRLEARLAGPKVLNAFGSAFPEAVFVEIGANDGDRDDHLRPMITRSAWRGVMVEPVPYVFQRLQANYGGLERVILENSAIADRTGTIPFYEVDRSGDGEAQPLPAWCDGIGSLSREVVASHARLIPDIEKHIKARRVPCLTFDALCAKHGLDTVDLLLLDTEGYDYKILRSVDLSRYRPTLVVYEHYHLSAPERAQCSAYLRGAGYETMAEGFDTWCLHRDVNRRLAARWSRLSPALPELSAEDEPR